MYQSTKVIVYGHSEGYNVVVKLLTVNRKNYSCRIMGW